MTAAELIDLLKRHPKAMRAIHLDEAKFFLDDAPNSIKLRGQSVWLHPKSDRRDTDDFRRWLLGACVEWCDEHGIEVLKSSLQRGVSQYVICRHFVTEDTPYKSRLHACLAAIENHTP